jgi:hypothetical protein
MEYIINEYVYNSCLNLKDREYFEEQAWIHGYERG